MKHGGVLADSHIFLSVEVDDFVDSFVFGTVSVYHVVAQFSVLFANPGNSGFRYLRIEWLVFQVDLLVVLF